MNRLTVLLLGLPVVALLSSCGTMPASQRKALFSDAASFYVEDMMKPLLSMCAWASVYWVKERKWPDSLEELAAMEEADDERREILSKLSDVVFKPQPDGSIAVSGAIIPPATLGGQPVKSGPITFDARITMERDPETESGWKPHIETGMEKPTEQPELRPEPEVAGGRDSS